MVNSGRTVGQQLADSFLGDRCSSLFPKKSQKPDDDDDVDSVPIVDF